jgi:dTDP-4-amino-4,6-dideoxygalactose transaminase
MHLAEAYLSALADLPLRLPCRAPAGETHAWHLFPIRLEPEAGMSRDDLVKRLGEAAIGVSVHYVPLHMHPYWRDTYNLRHEDFPVSTAAYEAMVSLPIYSKMTDADVDRVIAACQDVLPRKRA